MALTTYYNKLRCTNYTVPPSQVCVSGRRDAAFDVGTGAVAVSPYALLPSHRENGSEGGGENGSEGEGGSEGGSGSGDEGGSESRDGGRGG